MDEAAASSARRVAVVTGAGQGLGRAIAIELAGAGFAVAALGRTAAKVEETAALIGEGAIAVAVDLTRPADVNAAFAEVEARFGQIDTLVNNAAAYVPFLIEDATDDQIDQVIAGTFTSAVYCIRAAIPRMRAAGGGNIVNISSESVHLPIPYLLLYTAAKAALDLLTTGLRAELKGSGIRCMTLETGRISDSSVAGWDPDLLATFTELFVSRGYAALLALDGVTPATLARTVVHIITAPGEVNIETVRLRHS